MVCVVGDATADEDEEEDDDVLLVVAETCAEVELLEVRVEVDVVLVLWLCDDEDELPDELLLDVDDDGLELLLAVEVDDTDGCDVEVNNDDVVDTVEDFDVVPDKVIGSMLVFVLAEDWVPVRTGGVDVTSLCGALVVGVVESEALQKSRYCSKACSVYCLFVGLTESSLAVIQNSQPL